MMKIGRTRITDDQVDEAPVPVLLRITLRTLLALGVAPTRLRRARAGWLLSSASPTLITFERLIVVVVNIVIASTIILNFTLPPKFRARPGTTAISDGVMIIDICNTTIIHNLGVSAALNMRHMVTMLQEIHKIKGNLTQITDRTKYDKLKQSLLTFYIIWNIVTFIGTPCNIVYCRVIAGKNLLVSGLWLVTFYQVLAATLVQLHWSIALQEIYSTLTVINDELEFLLERATATITPEFVCRSTRLLHASYDTICELLRGLNDHYGKFLCIFFIFLFLSLLRTPFNILVCIGRKDLGEILQQANWDVLHCIQLLTLVEPCHRLQKQKNRTKRLLRALAHQASCRRQLPLHLKPFILQTLLLNSPLTLSDVFTISRPVLASVIGGVITYLIIIIQMQSRTEIL